MPANKPSNFHVTANDLGKQVAQSQEFDYFHGDGERRRQYQPRRPPQTTAFPTTPSGSATMATRRVRLVELNRHPMSMSVTSMFSNNNPPPNKQWQKPYVNEHEHHFGADPFSQETQEQRMRTKSLDHGLRYVLLNNR
jgi:hypothetical protein